MGHNPVGLVLSAALTLIAVVSICKKPGGGRVIIDRPLIPYQAQSQQIFRIQINKGDQMVTFFMNLDSTIGGLYEKAQSFQVLRHLNDTVFKAENGRLVRNDPSTTLLKTLSRESLANQVMPIQLNLTVFAVEQIEITVHITNGDDTMSFIFNASTRSHEVYQRAVDCGIMKDFHQFWLQFRYIGDKALFNDANPSAIPQKLLKSIDPWNPHELSLVVSPVSEGVLLFAMFRDMAPNQGIPWWGFAQFCFFDPWNVLCASLSRDGFGHWTNQAGFHLTVSIRNWRGELHLACIPPSVQSMTLTGQSIKVNFQSLRFTSLKVLTLDFEKIKGFQIASLNGSSLEILRVPGYSGMQDQDTENVLKILAMMRANDEIQLERIHFGRIEGAQCMIRYNPEAQDYDYFEEVN